MDATKNEKDWFPKTNVHVFLSHSHADEDLVKDFADYLYEHYKITSFIDSTVWRYADDLLEQINKKFCMYKDSNGKPMYDHTKAKRSAAQVYLLPQGALAKMIDQCECLIFINTPNSLNISDVKGKEKTASAWIYSELLMASTFPARSLKDYRKDQMMHYATSESMVFEPQLSSFIDLEADDLDRAAHRLLPEFRDPKEILGQLYKEKGLLPKDRG